MADINIHRVRSARVTETTLWQKDTESRVDGGETGLSLAVGHQPADYFVQKIEIQSVKSDGTEVYDEITLFSEDAEYVSLLDPTPIHPATLAHTVADIEPGKMYEIPGYDDNGCWLEDRGRVYVTNVIPDGGMVVVEGVWFEADYADTRRAKGADGSFRSPALMCYRTAIPV